jgi:hypothetical protein
MVDEGDDEPQPARPDFSWRPAHWGGRRPDRTFDQAMTRFNEVMAQAWVSALEQRLLPEWWWDEECVASVGDRAGHPGEREAIGLRTWIYLLLTSQRTEGQHIGAPAVRVFPTRAALEQARTKALREGIEQVIEEAAASYEARSHW